MFRLTRTLYWDTSRETHGGYFFENSSVCFSIMVVSWTYESKLIGIGGYVWEDWNFELSKALLGNYWNIWLVPLTHSQANVWLVIEHFEYFMKQIILHLNYTKQFDEMWKCWYLFYNNRLNFNSIEHGNHTLTNKLSIGAIICNCIMSEQIKWMPSNSRMYFSK